MTERSEVQQNALGPGNPWLRGSVGLWIGLAIGGPIMIFGIAGAIGDSAQTRPPELLRWIVGAAVVHDLVFVPVVLASLWVLRRPRVPAWAMWALATSVVLVLFSWPLLRGYGRNPTVPSLLPRDYGRALAAYIGAVWVLAIACALMARRHRGRAEHRRPRPPSSAGAPRPRPGL